RAAGKAHAEPHPHDGMPAEYLPGCKDQTLSRRKLRHVARLLGDMEGFKKNPQGVSWVCQSAVSEGVGREEVAKLIVDNRDGGTSVQRQSLATPQRQQANQNNGCRPMLSNPVEGTPCCMKPPGTWLPPYQTHQEQQQGHPKFKKDQWFSSRKTVQSSLHSHRF